MMGKFRYYVVWQRRGNFSLNDDMLCLDQDINSEQGIAAAKSFIGAPHGIDETEVILVNWKRID